MQNHALIIEGMLLRNALWADLVENCLAQQMRAKGLPNRRFPQFWIENARRPKPDALTDQVIAALRAGVTEGLRGAPGVSGDHRDEQSDAVVGGGGGMNEAMQRERPRKNAQ